MSLAPFHVCPRYVLDDVISYVLLMQLKVQRPVITFVVTLLELDQIVQLTANGRIGYYVCLTTLLLRKKVGMEPLRLRAPIFYAVVIY